MHSFFTILPKTLLFFLALYATVSCAVDNPDAPDYISDFLAQANNLEQNIRQGDHTNQEYIEVYADYEKFLDQELNKAYKRFLSNLAQTEQISLKQSQRNWIVYRDAEFEFINTNWNRENFGSSYIISRGDYRTKLIKQRVIMLLQYQKNYAE